MYKTHLLIFFFLLIISCDEKETTTEPEILTTKIAFGSCGSQDHDLPIFNKVVEHNADMFVFLGDNIYGDTQIMDTLKAKYQRLDSLDSYLNLKQNMPIYATWDDHDYGWNDAGKEYPFKKESKEIFMDFFEEPIDSERRNHEGIYHSYIHEYGDKKLQIILLDVRTFRDKVVKYSGEFDDDSRYDFYHLDYGRHLDSTKTLLGQEQWQWLENQLKKPADIRLIGSGTQFSIEWNGYEAWANFPHEQKKMLNLIKNTRASGVMFITGDVHYSEVSKLHTDFYPIYDFTSSGLSSTWKFATPNRNRIEGPIMDNHFGLITIKWEENPAIKMETWDINDNQRLEYSINLEEISF